MVLMNGKILNEDTIENFLHNCFSQCSCSNKILKNVEGKIQSMICIKEKTPFTYLYTIQYSL